MVDLQNKQACPTLDEIAGYVENPVFLQFCSEIRNAYPCREKIEFSSCSWEPGWNIKWKKAGKTLCTVYPRKHSFAVMVVIGKKEKPFAEAVLAGCTPELQEIYARTKEGGGQRWLMVELESHGSLYQDVLRLIQIRGNC